MKITAFGSYTFPLAEVRDDFGGTEVLSPLVNTPFGPVDGLPGQILDYGSDVLTKEFDLIAATPSLLATAIDAVRALRGTRALLSITPQGGSARTSYARCMSVRYTRTRRNFNAQRVSLRFLVEQNLWNGTAHDDTAGKTTGQTVIMANGGNANVDDLRIEITAPAGGAISAINIACTGLVDLTYAGPLAASDVLILDSGEWLVMNDGVGDYAGLTLNVGHNVSGLFLLEPGNNTYTFTFTGGGTASIRTIFNDKWR